MEATTLLALPLELRRCIILEILKHRHRKAPILSNHVVENRVRIRNRFDDNYPIETNIYVRKHKDFIHGNALLQTNRQLRQDTLELIEDTLKRGKVEIPFVLDVMVVKDVGLLPTWMSCPYRPEHIGEMKINLRIFRPNKDVVPSEWIPAAQYEDCPRQHGINIDQWTVMVVILFYAMGRFSGSPKDTIKAGPPSLPEEGLNKLSLEEQPEAVDAYISAKAPYIVDEMLIDVKHFERFAEGKVIRGFVADAPKSSPYYREGYYNFGRRIFDEYYGCGPRFETNDYIERHTKSGRMSDIQLSCSIDYWASYLRDNCSEDSALFNQSPIRIYLDAMARNIRTVRRRGVRDEFFVMAGGTNEIDGPWAADSSWETIFCLPFEADDVVTAFKIEKKKKYQDENVLHYFRLAKRRMDLGWWDATFYKWIWNKRRS